MKLISPISPPQLGHASGNSSPTRASSFAQAIRDVSWWQGFLEQGDTPAAAEWLASKIVQLRIFPDDTGKMNHDVRAINGRLLVVSQFTLLGDARRGNRPRFVQAAHPEEAVPLYETFLQELEARTGQPPERGVFAADMQVSLVNDGPVTILLDSRGQMSPSPAACVAAHS